MTLYVSHSIANSSNLFSIFNQKFPFRIRLLIALQVLLHLGGESAPKSSLKLAAGTTSVSSTPKRSTIILLHALKHLPFHSPPLKYYIKYCPKKLAEIDSFITLPYRHQHLTFDL